jgi:hypothetical protein
MVSCCIEDDKREEGGVAAVAVALVVVVVVMVAVASEQGQGEGEGDAGRGAIFLAAFMAEFIVDSEIPPGCDLRLTSFALVKGGSS